MKSRELDKMDDPFTYIKQDDDVGEVEGLKWMKSNGVFPTTYVYFFEIPLNL